MNCLGVETGERERGDNVGERGILVCRLSVFFWLLRGGGGMI